MKALSAGALAATLLLSACAMPQSLRSTGTPTAPTAAAAAADDKNRPLEERCARLQKVPGGARAPGETAADVRAEAQAAARRGELDKACDWL